MYALDIHQVDFFSLDIQGGEADLLYHFPFDKFKIRSLAVEHFLDEGNVWNKTRDSKFIEFMESKGYLFIGSSFEPDYFFVLKHDPQWKDFVKKLQKLKYIF